jgi:hypothetical protein
VSTPVEPSQTKKRRLVNEASLTSVNPDYEPPPHPPGVEGEKNDDSQANGNGLTSEQLAAERETASQVVFHDD